MRDRDNQNHFGFDDVDHAERKASEDYAASPQKIWTSVLREGGEARHRFFHCLDEVVTEARGYSLVVFRRSEKFLAGGWQKRDRIH